MGRVSAPTRATAARGTPRDEIHQAREQALAEQEAHTARQIRQWLWFAGLACGLAAVFFVGTRTAPQPVQPVTYPISNPPDAAIAGPTPEEDAAAVRTPRLLVPVEEEAITPPIPSALRSEADLAERADDPGEPGAE